MYIDGKLAGQLQQSDRLANGSYVVPTGGDPALMSDDIFLCARSDLDPNEDRYYDGALANLMLFNAALTGTQIEALYNTYNPEMYATKEGTASSEAVAEASTASATYDTAEAALEAKDAGEYSTSDGGGGGGLSAGAIVGIAFGVMGGLFLVTVIGLLVGTAVRRRRAARRFHRFYDMPPTGGGGSGGGGAGTALGLGKAERGQSHGFFPGEEFTTIQLANNNFAKLKTAARGSVSPSAGSAKGEGLEGNTPVAASPGSKATPPGSSASGSTMTDDVDIDPGENAQPGHMHEEI